MIQNTFFDHLICVHPDDIDSTAQLFYIVSILPQLDLFNSFLLTLNIGSHAFSECVYGFMSCISQI